jgi:hypothetical protein
VDAAARAEACKSSPQTRRLLLAAAALDRSLALGLAGAAAAAAAPQDAFGVDLEVGEGKRRLPQESKPGSSLPQSLAALLLATFLSLAP